MVSGCPGEPLTLGVAPRRVARQTDIDEIAEKNDAIKIGGPKQSRRKAWVFDRDGRKVWVFDTVACSSTA
jgi:hypothetical protein